MLRNSLIGLFAWSLGMLATVSIAQIYTWVDEDGQKHFSQTPPKNTPSNAETLEVNAPQALGGTIAEQQKQQELDELGEKVDENNEARKAAGDTDRNNRDRLLTKKACKQATTRLQALKNTPRLYTKKDNGDYHWYTDDEKKNLISEATKEAKEFCKPSA